VLARSRLTASIQWLDEKQLASVTPIRFAGGDSSDAQQQSHPPSAAWLQFLLGASPAVHYIAEASGEFAATYADTGIEALTGYTPGRFTRHAAFWANHIHPDGQPPLSKMKHEGEDNYAAFNDGL